ncbi:MAG: FAD-binding domain [Bryobacterales bacterium]|nr:FAD-binding domain [Acidobacteriota bacterium]MCB9384238.1 FAD-binding domain [Bryobacterales bacterium]
MKIAISGAGIAGPTLAYWLLRTGHEPVLIEQAPELRTGGYVVDFWGLGFTVAERMGLRSRLDREGYKQREVRFVDELSRKSGGFSTDVFGDLLGDRFTTIRRGALVKMIYEALEGRVETIWGDRICRMDEHPGGVTVTLERGGAREFDLVIGADGLHSSVRALRFGPDAEYEKFLGYAVAAVEIEGYRPRDEGVYVIHPTASHQLARMSLREDRTLFLFIFRCDAERAFTHLSASDVRALLRDEFGGAGWEAGQILAQMERVDDIYFDRMSQIHMPSWRKGRCTLLGDAAAAVSLLAGEGTGLAMVEAYVLAGELGRAGDDYERAFAEYERRLRPFLEAKQKTAAEFASTFVPKTEFGVWVRNVATKLMNIPGVGALFMGGSLKDDFELPDYSFSG